MNGPKPLTNHEILTAVRTFKATVEDQHAPLVELAYELLDWTQELVLHRASPSAHERELVTSVCELIEHYVTSVRMRATFRANDPTCTSPKDLELTSRTCTVIIETLSLARRVQAPLLREQHKDSLAALECRLDVIANASEAHS